MENSYKKGINHTIFIEAIKIFYITSVCTATLISAVVHEALICIPCVFLSYWGINNIFLKEDESTKIRKKRCLK